MNFEYIERNNIIVSILIIISLFLTIFIIPNYFTDFAKMANMIIWFIIFFLSMKIPNEHTRFKAKSEKIKTIFMILIIYYVAYFALGLVVGYKNSPYSSKFFTILKNIFFYVGLALLQEYVRARLVNSTKNYTIIILVTCMFIILNIDFEHIGTNFINFEAGFEYTLSVIFPTIVKNGLLTYLAIVGGYQLAYSYKIPVTLLTILLPFFPNLDWFMLTGLEMVNAYVVYTFLNYEHKARIKRYTREELKKASPLKSLPTVIIIIICVLFVAGFFTYTPVALISNSMYPYIKRGDIVIVKKLNNEEIESLKIGTIIEYQLGDNVVIHRITQIGKDIDGNIIFTTKGDNNDSEDSAKVTKEQVLGEIKLRVKYLGYPSVWFSEMILSKDSQIDT